MTHALVLGAAAFLFGTLAGCQRKAEPPAFEVTFEVRSEEQVGVAAVKIAVDDHEVGLTDASGKLRLVLPPDGPEIRRVTVTCPSGSVAPERLPALKLTRVKALGDTTRFRPIGYATTCERATRDAVVVVLTEGASELPIKIQGKEVGSVDRQGIGHFLLTAKPGTEFEVTVDTARAPKLRPQNPSKSVVIGPTDDVVLFSQAFARAVKRRVATAPPPPPPRPTMIR